MLCPVCFYPSRIPCWSTLAMSFAIKLPLSRSVRMLCVNCIVSQPKIMLWSCVCRRRIRPFVPRLNASRENTRCTSALVCSELSCISMFLCLPITSSWDILSYWLSMCVSVVVVLQALVQENAKIVSEAKVSDRVDCLSSFVANLPNCREQPRFLKGNFCFVNCTRRMLSWSIFALTANLRPSTSTSTWMRCSPFCGFCLIVWIFFLSLTQF